MHRITVKPVERRSAKRHNQHIDLVRRRGRMIAQATLPDVGFDRNRVRDSLSALRLGHDGLEQFVGLFFDELAALREQLDEEQAQLDEEGQRLREAKAQIAAERNQCDTDRQHWHGALQKRVVDLERDKLALTAELDSERRRGAEAAKAAVDQQRHFAAERAEWMAELRQHRERSPIEGPADSSVRAPEFDDMNGESKVELDRAKHRSITDDERTMKAEERFESQPAVVAPRPKPTVHNPFESDPVMGPLMSQFQLLQRDVARRRAKKN